MSGIYEYLTDKFYGLIEYVRYQKEYVYNQLPSYHDCLYPVYFISYYMFDVKRLIYQQIKKLNQIKNKLIQNNQDTIAITNITIEHIHDKEPDLLDKYVLWGYHLTIPDDVYNHYNEHNNLMTITYTVPTTSSHNTEVYFEVYKCVFQYPEKPIFPIYELNDIRDYTPIHSADTNELIKFWFPKYRTTLMTAEMCYVDDSSNKMYQDITDIIKMYSGPKHNFYKDLNHSHIYPHSIFPKTYKHCQFISYMDNDCNEIMFNNDQRIL